MKLNKAKFKSAKLLKKEDFPKICRCCVSGGNLISIFALEYEEKPISEVMTHLFNTQVNANDDMPKNICETCFNEIVQFYDFKKMYDTSRVLIETIISHTYSISTSNNKIPENQVVQISGDNNLTSNDSIEITLEDSEDTTVFENPPELLLKDSKGVCEIHENNENVSEKECNIQEPNTNSKEAITAKNPSEEGSTVENVLDHNKTDSEEKKSFTEDTNNLNDFLKEMQSYSNKKKYECTVCCTIISSKDNLKRHMKIHTGEKPHICNICGKSFIQLPTLKEHQRVHTGEKRHLCTYCGKTFRTNIVFNIHLRTHGEKGESIDKALRAVSCKFCDKIFSTPGSLSAHLLRHGEKRFLCSDCGKSFFSKAALESHSRVHTGEKPFSCRFCRRPFAQLCTMKTHMLTHTGERPFTCKICSKSFTQSHHLKTHLRTHSGERPYMCPYCGKTYPQNTTLKVHIRTHTGETPYTCDLCSKAFHDPSALKRHKKLHASENEDVKDN